MGYSGLRSGDCYHCEDGQEVNSDQTGCENCEAGKYSTMGSNCKPCPKDTYSDGASGECSPCGFGHYAGEGMGKTSCQSWLMIAFVVLAAAIVAPLMLLLMWRKYINYMGGDK